MFQTKAKLETFTSEAAAIKGDRVGRRPGDVPVDEEAVALIEKFLSMGGCMGVKAMRESIGVGAWDSIMLDAMHKRLLKGWKAVQQRLHWSKLVSYTKPVSDFRTQYAIQTGDFTTLDEVPPKGSYHSAEFTDDRADYAVAKYGKSFGLSWEAIVNDDLGVLGNIVERFGGASGRTIEKYVVYTLIDQNPTIYDANSLFDDSNRSESNKLGSSKTLNHDNLEAAVKLMMGFTDLDGNALEIEPKYLLVHPNEKYIALRILKSIDRPGTGNNDVNVHKDSLELLVSSRVTSGQWYVIADPSIVDTIEIGFLGGRQEPEVFEEEANSGHAFAYDEKRWKGRVVFGAAVVDWRGFVGCNF